MDTPRERDDRYQCPGNQHHDVGHHVAADAERDYANIANAISPTAKHNASRYTNTQRHDLPNTVTITLPHTVVDPYAFTYTITIGVSNCDTDDILDTPPSLIKEAPG